jgi:predicted permease
MRSIRAWLLRAIGLFHGASRDEDLAAELESHLQLHVDDDVRAGMTPAAARRHALIALGGVEATKERYRDRRGLPSVDALWQDLRYAVRTLARRPLLLAATTLSIAIGAGINVSVYSVLQRVLFESLITGESPERLVWIRPGISYLNFQDLRTARLPVALATMTMSSPTWRTPDDTTTISAHLVSDNFFDVVRVRPAIGRTFHEGDADAAVLSFWFWRQRFGADPSVLGRAIEINGSPYIIVGVLPKDFRSQAIVSPGIYLPTGPHVAGALANRGAGYLDLIGRLADGATREQATAALRVAGEELETRYPSENKDFARGLTAVPAHALSVFGAVLPGGVAIGAAGIVYAMVGLVLLIACANVAGLLVARADERRREIAVRIALGASRARLARQFLAESVVIGALGCACGAVFWFWCAALIRNAPAVVAAGVNVVPTSLPLLYSAGLALFVTLACGIAPAWTASQVTPVAGLQAGRRGHAFRRFTLQRALVAGQVAISFLLLSASAILLFMFLRTRAVDPGFDVAHTAAVEVRLPLDSGPRSFLDLRDAVRSVAAIEVVSCDQSLTPPITFTEHIHRPDSPNDAGYAVAIPRVGPQYFEAMRIPIDRGRDLNDADYRLRPGVPVSVIVNQTFVRRYLAGADPIGQRFLLPGIHEFGRSARPAVIVGVVRDSQVSALNHDRVPVLYEPALSTFLVVRVAGPAAAALKDLERSITTRQPGAVVTARSMADRRAVALLPARVGAMLMMTLGALAIVVAMTGLYGVVSYTASRRTFEIGVRLALGATRPAIVRLILGEGLRLVGAGCVAGGLLALVFTQAVRAALSTGRSSADLLAFAAVVVMLFTAGLAATLWPARRAASVDPVVALRHE